MNPAVVITAGWLAAVNTLLTAAMRSWRRGPRPPRGGR